MKNIWKNLKKVLETLLLIFGVLGIGFIGGIAKPVYDNLPWVYRGAFEEKIESIKPTQSYEYIKSILEEAQVSEKMEFPLENGEIEIGTRKIWANELYTTVGYFRKDNSLYGYIVISQDEKFQPKIGSDFYNKNGFGNLTKTNFIDAHEKSKCYIDTVKGFYTSNVLCSSYYMELYDFNRSDFCYGLAITNLGVDNKYQINQEFYKVNSLPKFKIGETIDVDNPIENEKYKPYRELIPNAMMVFNNRCDIKFTEFIEIITKDGLAISYSDLRRLY